MITIPRNQLRFLKGKVPKNLKLKLKKEDFEF